MKRFRLVGLVLVVYVIYMKILIPTFVVLFGCEAGKERRIEGEFRLSPKHVVAYYGVELDGPGVDYAVDGWLEWCAGRGVDPEAARATLARVTVSLLEGRTVDGVNAAWWYPDDWIEIAREGDARDPYMGGMNHTGVLWLRHELIHALYRDGSHTHFD